MRGGLLRSTPLLFIALAGCPWPSPPPMAPIPRNAHVVSVQLWSKPRRHEEPVVFALDPKRGQLPLSAIRSAIPDPLPSPLLAQSCTSGTSVVLLLQGDRMVSYGPCRLPPSIAQLKAAALAYLARHP